MSDKFELPSLKGIITGYVLLFIMALLPIFVGSLRSITYKSLIKEGDDRHVSMKTALLYPVFSSIVLLVLYLFSNFKSSTASVITTQNESTLSGLREGLSSLASELHDKSSFLVCALLSVIIFLIGTFIIFNIIRLIFNCIFNRHYVSNYIKKERNRFLNSTKYDLKFGKRGTQITNVLFEVKFTAVRAITVISPLLLAVYWYFIAKFQPRNIIKMAIDIFFFSIKICTLIVTGSDIIEWFIKYFTLPDISEYILTLQKRKKKNVVDIIWEDALGILAVCLSVLIVCCQVFTQYWLLINLIGMSFCCNLIEMMLLKSVPVGCVLLGGFFIYDIFWVFGTNVMGKVAQKSDALVKLLIPLDLPEKGLYASNFGILGLGDIVVPGLFIALLCRFDFHHHPSKFKSYFYISFIAYIIGLIVTIGVMLIYNTAQPALLYLVPTCVGFPLLLALWRGEIGSLFGYDDSKII